EEHMVSSPVWSFADSWIVSLHPNYALLRPWPSGADVIEIPTGSAPVDCAFAGSDGSRLVVSLGDGPATLGGGTRTRGVPGPRGCLASRRKPVQALRDRPEAQRRAGLGGPEFTPRSP